MAVYPARAHNSMANTPIESHGQHAKDHWLDYKDTRSFTTRLRHIPLYRKLNGRYTIEFNLNVLFTYVFSAQSDSIHSANSAHTIYIDPVEREKAHITFGATYNVVPVIHTPSEQVVTFNSNETSHSSALETRHQRSKINVMNADSSWLAQILEKI